MCGAKKRSQSLFPERYSIALDKEALVLDYMNSFGTYVHRNLTFLRAVQDWELESVVAFLDLLYTSKTQPRETDKMLWSPARKQSLE
jgi:hypothetical protein